MRLEETFMLIEIQPRFAPPSEDDIVQLLMDAESDQRSSQVTRESIAEEVERARRWLEEATVNVSRFLEVRSLGNGESSAELGYREGEDLGYGCNNPGSSPFNTIYPQGPTLHLVLKGDVSVGRNVLGDLPNLDVRFENFIPKCKDGGCLLMLRVAPLGLWIAIRD